MCVVKVCMSVVVRILYESEIEMLNLIYIDILYGYA